MKKLIFIISGLLLIASCQRTYKEVVESYSNGNPATVYYYKGTDENKVKVGEEFYYPDGQLRAEKHFSAKDATPTGTWKFFYPNGKIFAQAAFSKDTPYGKDWKIKNDKGQDYYQGPCDSLRMKEFGEECPGTVYYYSADSIRVFQFYPDYSLKAVGSMRNNYLYGHWHYYYPNGLPLTDAIYIDGVQNGAYNSYRENGLPYFRGFYINGKRAGIWEFYDQEGNLEGTKNFDENAQEYHQ